MARILRMLPVLALAIGTALLVPAIPAAADEAVSTDGYTWSNGFTWSNGHVGTNGYTWSN